MCTNFVEIVGVIEIVHVVVTVIVLHGKWIPCSREKLFKKGLEWWTELTAAPKNL